jgi:hypothetical protein
VNVNAPTKNARDKLLDDLLDKQAIYENGMKYCRGIDRYDLATMKSAYWPDSTDDHGSFIGNGHEFCETAYNRRARLRSMNHHMGNTQIELLGDQAKCESYYLVASIWADPDGKGDVQNLVGGRYKDLYEKRDGEWKILRRVCVWDWSSDTPATVNWGRGKIPLTDINTGRWFPEDPIYSKW